MLNVNQHNLALPCFECFDHKLAFSFLQFNDRAHAVGDYKLRVVYVLPSHQQSPNFGGLERGSSLNGSVMQERSLSGSQVVHFSGNIFFVFFVFF